MGRSRRTARPQTQPQYQPQQGQSQPQAQPQPSGNDVGGLPSFITGGQPVQAPQYGGGSNGHDGQGDRFHRRRRRHRGPHNPDQDVRGDAPPEPGNE